MNCTFNYSTYVGTQMGRTEKTAFSTETRREFVTRHNETTQTVTKLGKESTGFLKGITTVKETYEEVSK